MLALFFGGTLMPALGFIDVFPMIYSWVADHFQYLASIGPIVGLAALATRITGRPDWPPAMSMGTRVRYVTHGATLVAAGTLERSKGKATRIIDLRGES